MFYGSLCISDASSFNTDTTIADTLSNFANIEYKVIPGLVSSMAIKRKEQETKNAIKLLKDIEKELKHVDGKVDKTLIEETACIISDGKRICGKKRKSKVLVKATGMVTDVIQAYNGTIWASACQNNESVIIYLGHIDQVLHFSFDPLVFYCFYFYFGFGLGISSRNSIEVATLCYLHESDR